jgi:hypothetical protein
MRFSDEKARSVLGHAIMHWSEIVAFLQKADRVGIFDLRQLGAAIETMIAAVGTKNDG